MSLIRGRAENARVPEALAYYDRLERESKQVYEVVAVTTRARSRCRCTSTSPTTTTRRVLPAGARRSRSTAATTASSRRARCRTSRSATRGSTRASGRRSCGRRLALRRNSGAYSVRACRCRAAESLSSAGRDLRLSGAGVRPRSAGYSTRRCGRSAVAAHRGSRRVAVRSRAVRALPASGRRPSEDRWWRRRATAEPHTVRLRTPTRMGARKRRLKVVPHDRLLERHGRSIGRPHAARSNHARPSGTWPDQCLAAFKPVDASPNAIDRRPASGSVRGPLCQGIRSRSAGVGRPEASTPDGTARYAAAMVRGGGGDHPWAGVPATPRHEVHRSGRPAASTAGGTPCVRVARRELHSRGPGLRRRLKCRRRPCRRRDGRGDTRQYERRCAAPVIAGRSRPWRPSGAQRGGTRTTHPGAKVQRQSAIAGRSPVQRRSNRCVRFGCRAGGSPAAAPRRSAPGLQLRTGRRDDHLRPHPAASARMTPRPAARRRLTRRAQARRLSDGGTRCCRSYSAVTVGRRRDPCLGPVNAGLSAVGPRRGKPRDQSRDARVASLQSFRG